MNLSYVKNEKMLINIVDGHFRYYLIFPQICLNRKSIGNHQSSQDWNDLEVAYASRIKPDVKGTFQNRFI